MQPKGLKPQGIALVTALIAALAAAALLGVLTASVLSELRQGQSVRVRNELAQAADSLSERVRLELVLAYRNGGLSAPAYLDRLRGDNTIREVALESGITGRWRVRGVSPSNSGYGWVEIAATASRANSSQTVIRRIAFGQGHTFNLAMLAENPNCMFCHLRVRGDVGALHHFRPGWGWEGHGESTGSGGREGGSVVYGDVYAATTITDDDTSLERRTYTSGPNELEGVDPITARRINGALVTGRVEVNSTNPALPQDVDGDGIPDFPPIRRAVAQASANGSLTGGVMVGIPRGGSLTSLTPNLASVSRVYDGNLVLIGTPENPLVIDKDIYVTGDVVIKGVVTGRGAIYAGRNLYIAGNLTYKNPPDPPGQGVCAGVNDPDACARRNIQDGRDELRLAARGNTVLGDYTERDERGRLLPLDLRQSAEFYRTQYAFWTDRSRSYFYHKNTGDELRLRDGRYYNVEGEEVPEDQVVRVSPDQDDPGPGDAYSYSFRPGYINPGNGEFAPWISDADYRRLLLGQESLAYNTWRWSFYHWEGNLAAYRNRVQRLLEPSLLRGTNRSSPEAEAWARDTANRLACTLAKLLGNPPGCPDGNPEREGDLTFQGNPIGYFHIQREGEMPTIRVVWDQALEYGAQVTRVDAFLYSNLRIVGRTSMLGVAMNGGLVAKELGILAPGRRGAWWMDGAPWNTNSRYRFLWERRDCANPGTAYHVEGTESCALTVNYDHRMRNGGHGFNLVVGNPGQTVAWRLSADPGEQVR